MNIVVNTLGKWLDLPFNLPETKIVANDTLCIYDIVLEQGFTLNLSWLTLSFLSLENPNIITKTSGNLANLYVGLYYENTYNLSNGSPLVYLPAEVPGLVRSILPCNPYVFTTPGDYKLLLVNNTSNVNIFATVNATFKLVTNV